MANETNKLVDLSIRALTEAIQDKATAQTVKLGLAVTMLKIIAGSIRRNEPIGQDMFPAIDDAIKQIEK